MIPAVVDAICSVKNRLYVKRRKPEIIELESVLRCTASIQIKSIEYRNAT